MTASRPRLVVVATLARLGGAERSLVALLARLAGALDVTVLAPEDGPLVGAVTATGAACRIVPWPRSLATSGERAGARLGALARALGDVGVLRIRLAAALAELRPDVVVTNGIKAHVLGALVRRATAAPLVWYAREGLEDRPLSRVLLRALGRRCDGVVAISRYVAGEFRPLVPGPAPVHVVPNIVEPASVRPGLALPADLRKAAGELWIGVVGALTPLKGQDVFLDAAARVAAELPAARFLVVGGEPYRTESRLGYGTALRERAHALGIGERVRFLGERADAPAVIANLDVLVQPSRGPEGLGRVILEAMGCGVPVVTVDRWGPRELVRHGETGFLVPPGDSRALAEALLGIAREPTRRTAVGAAARRWFDAHADPIAAAAAFRAALASIARLPSLADGAAGQAVVAERAAAGATRSAR